MRKKLKKYYFYNFANNINLANEARKDEEEFRLCKTYTMGNHSNKQLISNDKLTTFFEDNFKGLYRPSLVCIRTKVIISEIIYKYKIVY